MPKTTKWKAKYKPLTCSSFGPEARSEHIRKQCNKKWNQPKNEDGKV